MKTKVTLKELVGTKIIYAVLLVSYYWMWARRDWHDYYETVQMVVGIFTIVFFLLQAGRIRRSCSASWTAKEFDMALKTKVREYREKAGYKQSELAEMVNARRETIVHLENGKYNPSLKLAMDIAKVFHVTVEELFEFTED